MLDYDQAEATSDDDEPVVSELHPQPQVSLGVAGVATSLGIKLGELKTMRLSSTKPQRGNILKRWARVIIVPGSWGGSDIFFARGGCGDPIISEKFKTFCEIYTVMNVAFVLAEEFGHDFYPWEKSGTID